MDFYPGLHHPADAQHFDRAFVSVNVLRKRKKPLKVKKMILDSGAFSLIFKHGHYPDPPEEYAAQIVRIKRLVEEGGGELLAAVTQDYMCEPFILEKTGLTVGDHQRLTIERYDALIEQWTGVYIMPVLQGYKPDEYVDHIRMYGNRLTKGMWVGVGSVCKRNSNPKKILDVLMAIKMERPDLRLHGFGLKTTALRNGTIRYMLESADSMAWSFSARKGGRNQNDWREADSFRRRIEVEPQYQQHFIEMFLQNQDIQVAR